jgi:hypothetical protein
MPVDRLRFRSSRTRAGDVFVTHRPVACTVTYKFFSPTQIRIQIARALPVVNNDAPFTAISMASYALFIHKTISLHDLKHFINVYYINACKKMNATVIDAKFEKALLELY